MGRAHVCSRASKGWIWLVQAQSKSTDQLVFVI